MNRVLTMVIIVSGFSLGSVDGEFDGIKYAAATNESQISIAGEGTNRSSSGSYRPSSPNATHTSGSWSSSPLPVVIRDSSGSFCESDLQSGLCIPDPGEADPGEPGEEEDASPSVVDVVTAASVQIERDIARLGVEPARINVKPPGGQVLINIDTIFFTEASVQYLSTSVLGRAVTIEVVPVWFEWDFGDGSPVLGTADPGAGYPEHTVSHVYTAAGEQFVSLTTTWSARFRVEGVTNWIPVRGQPVTVDETGPLQTLSKTTRLVTTDSHD